MDSQPDGLDGLDGLDGTAAAQIRAILLRAADQLDAALEAVREIAERQRELADDPVLGEEWETLARQDVPEAGREVYRAIKALLGSLAWRELE